MADPPMMGILAASASRNTTVFIDISVSSQAALNLAERLAPTKTGKTCRMYRGAALELPAECIFGDISIEMG